MQEYLAVVTKWIVKNKEWLFSGAGLTIIGWIFMLVSKRKLRNDKKTDNSNDKSLNVFYTLEQTKEKPSEKNNEVYGVVERFIRIFEAHGIYINQISSFIDPIFDLKISDFKDKDSILNILDDRLLEWTCNTFGIERDWLDGRDKRIYSSRNYYKDVINCIRYLVELKKQHENNIEVYMFKNGLLNPDVYGKTYVIFIIKIPIKQLNRKMINRYIPITTNWDWGYWRSRYQIKSIIYFINRLNIHINGYDLSDEFTELASGYSFPEPILKKIQIGHTWYPEDYIDLSSQSMQAKETDETMKVRKYIEEEGYNNFFQKLVNNS